MQNHKLAIYSDRIWADSTTAKNTLKYLRTYGVFLKKLHLGVRSPSLVPTYMGMDTYYLVDGNR